MKFLFLIHGDDEAEGAMTPDERRAIVAEHMAFADMLRNRGAYVLGEALEGRESAAVVRRVPKPRSRCSRSRRSEPERGVRLKLTQVDGLGSGFSLTPVLGC